MYKCVLTRENEYDNNEVYRSFEEYCELYNLLNKTFSTLRLNETLPFNKFKETKTYARRFQAVEQLLRDIFSLQGEISQSEIIYTFFHSILRDRNQESAFVSGEAHGNIHRSLSISHEGNFFCHQILKIKNSYKFFQSNYKKWNQI
jgi:hypothetical protein